MRTLVQDLRYSLRMLRKQPAFTAIAVLTLALAIGANTAIFSVLNTMLLRPLPFKNPDRLVAMYELDGRKERDWISLPNLEDYRNQNHVFEEMSTFVSQSVNLTGIERPDRMRGGFVTSSFFNVLGVQSAMGRVLSPAEDKQGGERAAVLNYESWQKRFGGDPQILGRTLTLNGEPFTVVGVMPEGFSFPMDDEVEVWLPAPAWPNYEVKRSSPNAFVIGRLKEGVALAAAQVEMGGITARLAQTYPEDNRGRGLEIVGLHQLLVENVRPVLLILLGAVGFILLIACANIANLLLARGASRFKEVAVRAALGASRPRLIRQLLTETVVLSAIGGGLGLLLALWGVDLLGDLAASQFPIHSLPRLDARVLEFTILVTLLTGLLFGLMPALQLSKPDLYGTLKEGRGAGESAGRHRLRSTFVVSQVALSLVLLVGAGLLINSFYRLLRTSPGFAPENLLTMEYRLPKNRYPQGEQQLEFHRRVVEKVRELPGVKSAAVIRGMPFSGNGGASAFVLTDRPQPPQGQELRADNNLVGEGYFETVGIPLIKGRTFTERDTAETPAVAVINQKMAQTYWPGDDPIGKQIQLPEEKLTVAVVGVVGNTKQFELNEPQHSQIYISYSQAPTIFATLVVRTQVEPMSLADSVRAAVWSVDKDQPVWKVRTVQSLLDRNVAPRRLIMSLMASFAGLAMLITAIGLYGVISYSVSQRTQEIGVRMALGARRADVLKLVVRQGMKLTLIGLGIGLVAACAVTRVMSKLLYGVGATDPLTFMGVAVLLAVVSFLACFIPARRATKIDPMVALRYE